MRRKYCVLAALLCLALSASACGLTNMDEISSALKKTNEADSLSFNMDVQGDFSIIGMDETLPEGVTAEQMEETLNQMSISYGGSMVLDKEHDQAETEMDFSVNAMGMIIASRMWQRFSEDGKILEQIVQNPQIPGFEVPGKEYMVNRIKVDDAAEQNKLVTAMINEFIIENSKDEKFITKTDNRRYKIHVDKDKAVKLFEDIFDIIASSASDELAPTGIDLDDQYESIKNVLPAIIGDKGIDIEILIGDDGYVSEEKIMMDMDIDLSKIAEAMGEAGAGGTGEIGLDLTMDMDFFDYNSVEKIEFPEITEDNADIIETP